MPHSVVPPLAGPTAPVSWVKGACVRTAIVDDARRFRVKRAMDLVGATLMLLTLLPLLLVIAALIKIDSPGPIIFVQERAGTRRRRHRGQTSWEPVTFRFFKFRSMVNNANETLHQEFIQQFTEGRVDTTRTVKLTNDPRITRMGRVLRRTSLDELPQIFNVLIGDMSLVGPRPVPLYEAAAYQDWHRERLATLPGLTGLWQVKGRGRTSFTEMIELDIEYVRNQSLVLDLQLLIATIPAIVSGRGAE